MQFQQAQCAMTPESLFCKALGTSQVTLYKTLEGHACAQAAISGDYEKYVEEFAGFSQGTCADQGFKHADGTKTIAVPIIGNITVNLYDNVLKADQLVTVYEMAGTICGQATLNKNIVKYVEEFAKLQEGTCASQGYTVEDGEKDIHIPIVGDVKIDLYAKSAAQRKANLVIDLWQVKGSECGQIEVAKKYEMYVLEKFDKDLAEGTCAAQGYTVEQGEKTVQVPLMGDVVISAYKKSAVAIDTAATLYQVEAGICAQATVAKKFEAIFEKIDSKFVEGTCSSAGYTQDDGEKDITVPWVGEIKLALYTKAKNNLQMMI